MTHLTPDRCLLADLGVIAIRGADARKFLQGQLSQDVLGLRADRVELAGLHNPQGRVLALLRLVPDDASDVLCVLPRELVTETTTLLRKFLLRAKATVTDESAHWQIEGLTDDPALDRAVGAARRVGDALYWRHAADGRVLCLQRAVGTQETAPVTDTTAAARWALADIATGLPEITLATRGEFVAQMLNLDVLGGISFTKGCYTGQEVVARAHYRGRVKRRVQRFRAYGATTLAAGQKITLEVTQQAQSLFRSAQIVNVFTSATATEFLAVTAFDTSETSTETAPGDSPALAVEQLPMSYSLPD